jgi:hypothetical protein
VNSIRRRCINGELVHRRMFSYLKEFWKNHRNDGKMVLAPMQESHEASMDVISTLDKDMAELIEWLWKTGELNRTVLVITSDHGSHMSLYYIFSQIGKLEHKMPELFMVFPEWFLEKYKRVAENLKSNEQPLITHYDTHWALAELSQLEEFGGKKENFTKNGFISVWDCRRNEKYIKDIWYFREKRFYNVDAQADFEKLVPKVLERVKKCIGLYADERPNEDPIGEKVKEYGRIELENIPPCESEKCFDVNVFEVIKDKGAYFWFLDAIVDLEDKEKRKENEDIFWQYNQDLKVFTEFKAPGCGRYKYGKSLFHYTENKTCDDIGTKEWCACS